MLALTHDNQVNLKIAITSKLLNKAIKVVSRADTHETMANMASFDTDYIINPFQMFAKRLALAIRSPGAYLVYDWFTNPDHSLRDEPPIAPKGQWIVCGYGRFGKAVTQYLQYEGIKTVIIEAKPQSTDAPGDVIKGNGTEAITLKDAGIYASSGLIAGTDNDSNNLSIIMTAKEIKQGQSLFTVARQNYHRNSIVFDAAHLDLVMQPATIVAREIIAIIKTPLLADFLRLVNRQKKTWVNYFISRLAGLFSDEIQHTWTINMSLSTNIKTQEKLQESGILLGDLLRSPDDRHLSLSCIPLMIKIKKPLKKSKSYLLLPKLDHKIKLGDKILFCGDLKSMHKINFSLQHRHLLDYIIDGIPYDESWLWKKMTAKKG